MLDYSFFRTALLAVTVMSIAGGIIGTYVVVRRMVSLAGGITHACFGGLGLGYFLGWNPALMAMVFAVGAALGVDGMSRSGRVRTDTATAVVWALGMAVGVLFVFLTPGYVPELNAFLFGNILMVSRVDLWMTVGFTVLLVAWLLLRFRTVRAVAFDPDYATVRGMSVGRVTVVMTCFMAVGIVLIIRLAGVMLLMSVLTLPVIVAERFCHRLLPLTLVSICISLAGSVAGLMLSTVVNVPCSALIVIVLAAIYLISLPMKTLHNH